MSPRKHSLDGVWTLAEVQGLVPILRDGLRVGAESEQQPQAVGAGGAAGFVQSRAAPGSEVDGSAAQQQQPQAGGVAPAGRDVQRCGQLLLVAQRPDPCRTARA